MFHSKNFIGLQYSAVACLTNLALELIKKFNNKYELYYILLQRLLGVTIDSNMLFSENYSKKFFGPLYTKSGTKRTK